MIRHVTLFVIVALVSFSQASAEDQRETLEVEIAAGIDDVWNAFTTTEGLKTWVAPLIDIDFRIGGIWKANYNADGELGDETTIENTVLSYDPKRMLTLKATKFPKDFPFVEAARSTWTVFYFSPVSDSRTKITVVGLGYTDTEQSRKMRSFFEVANQYSLDQLNNSFTLAPEPGVSE